MLLLADRQHKTLEEVRNVSLDELELWMSWIGGEFDPFRRQEQWLDYKLSSVMAAILNAAIKKWVFNARDFMPQEKKKLSLKEVEHRLAAWAASAGGKVKVDRKGTKVKNRHGGTK